MSSVGSTHFDRYVELVPTWNIGLLRSGPTANLFSKAAGRHGFEVHGFEVHGFEVHGFAVHGFDVHGFAVHGFEVQPRSHGEATARGITS
jgi:hypothetical protein